MENSWYSSTFLYQLVSVVIDIMKDFYPYLMDKKQLLKNNKNRRREFFKNFIYWRKKLEEILSFSKNKIVSGEQAFCYMILSVFLLN